jgi:hypothetical protein
MKLSAFIIKHGDIEINENDVNTPLSQSSISNVQGFTDFTMKELDESFDRDIIIINKRSTPRTHWH